MKDKIVIDWLKKFNFSCNPYHGETLFSKIKKIELKEILNRLSENGSIIQINYPNGYYSVRLTKV